MCPMHAEQLSDDLWRSLKFELRHLRYFVALAEELNFRRAAQRAFVTQSALSKQIAALEHDLGVGLFRRNRRGVELTEAGHAFLAAIPSALTQLERSVGLARRAAGLAGVLRVGFPEYASQTCVPDLLRRFEQVHPDVRVEQYELITTLQIRALGEGRLDFGLLSELDAPGQAATGEGRLRGLVADNLALLPVAAEPVVVALAEGSHLAVRGRLPLRTLAGERIILTSWRFRQYAAACGQAAGFNPEFMPLGNLQGYSGSTIARMVAGGDCVTLVPSSQAKIRYPGIVFRPLCEPAMEYQIHLCWVPTRETTLISAFVEQVRQFRAG